MIYEADTLPSKHCITDALINDSYNLCAMAVGRCNSLTFVIILYRAPWASITEIKICVMLWAASLSNTQEL